MEHGHADEERGVGKQLRQDVPQILQPDGRSPVTTWQREKWAFLLVEKWKKIAIKKER